MHYPWTRYLIINVRVYVSLTCGFQRRARFQPLLYRVETPKEAASHTHAVATPRSPEPSETTNPHKRPKLGLDFAVRRLSSQDQYRISGISSRSPSDSDTLSPAGNEFSVASSNPPDFPSVLEVWFAGCHSDVGGGSVEDTVRFSLGDISLRWMVKQVLLSDCGIVFDEEALWKADIDVSTIVLANPAQQIVAQQKERRSGARASTTSSAPLIPHREGDGEDDMNVAQILSQEPEVRADTYDELKIKLKDFSLGKLGTWLGYWVLERIIPATFVWHDENGDVQSQLR